MIGSIGGHKGYDVNPEGERILCDWAAKEHGVEAIFVYAMGFDCLFRGLEITTTSGGSTNTRRFWKTCRCLG